MKKRIKAETASFPERHNVSQKNGTGTFKCLLINDHAWVDLILSKAALILATVVILAAVYSLAGSSSDLVKKDELEAIAVDLASTIDSAGSIRSSAGNNVAYSFDTYSGSLIKPEELNISISGEYVTCIFEDEGRDVIAARPLSYRTLPFNQSHLDTLLSGHFGADGNMGQPVYSAFPYSDVTEFLSLAGNDELYLNISNDVCIEKTSVFVTDGTGVDELEYILVYQG